jgi:protein involved in polysaccharide export with SLBB domain
MNGKACFLLVLILTACGLSGCAAFSNPVAGGIPVSEVPPELLGKPREAQQLIPLTLLRQPEPEAYRLAAGDVLGIWIEGVLGERNQAPPVQLGAGETGHALGFPIPVREDGTISLPFVDPIKVDGLTMPETEKRIFHAFTVEKKILQPDAARIIVTLLSPRTYQVLVIREDSGGGLAVGAGGLISGGRRGSGAVVSLPAYKNDVLTALTQTGGLPGLDAQNQVIILRGEKGNRWQGTNGTPCFDPALLNSALGGSTNGDGVTRIPLRLSPEEPIPFQPADVILQDGDIVYVPARDTELFYTAGLLISAQYVLPRDYDLDVVEAVALTGGPLINGGTSVNNLSGTIGSSGLGKPSPSHLTVLRKTAEGGQIAIRVDLNRAMVDSRERILVLPSDILILQETMGEASFRYVTTVLTHNFLFKTAQSPDVIGSSTLVLP